jgi:hypothetical protein
MLVLLITYIPAAETAGARIHSEVLTCLNVWFMLHVSLNISHVHLSGDLNLLKFSKPTIASGAKIIVDWMPERIGDDRVIWPIPSGGKTIVCCASQ